MNNTMGSNSKLEITDFQKQKNQLSDVKYKNVKEFCDSLSLNSVSDFEDFVLWVENKFGNEKVKFSNGQECSVWFYLLIFKESEAFEWGGIGDDIRCQLLKQDIKATGWLTFFVCVSALFSVILVGIPFLYISGKELMARNLHNDQMVLNCYEFIPKNKRKSVEDCWRYLNNLSKFQKNKLKSDDDFDFNK